MTKKGARSKITCGKSVLRDRSMQIDVWSLYDFAVKFQSLGIISIFVRTEIATYIVFHIVSAHSMRQRSWFAFHVSSHGKG